MFTCRAQEIVPWGSELRVGAIGTSNKRDAGMPGINQLAWWFMVEGVFIKGSNAYGDVYVIIVMPLVRWDFSINVAQGLDLTYEIAAK